MPTAHPLLGTFFHTVGAASAALCYAPQRGVKLWKWQTYWLIQALGCWLIFPWIFAVATIPELGAVLHEAPSAAMLHSYLWGVLYGVGGIAFGVSIRYLGFSLTYALAIGVSCVLGTLLPPLMAGTLGAALSSVGGQYVVGGVLLGGAAMVATGWAGFRRDQEGSEPSKEFNPRIGLPICLLAGVLSAVFNFSLQAGQPVADVAARHGAGNFQGNVIYLFSNSGAFTTTLVYCVWLAFRDRSWGEFVGVRSAETEVVEAEVGTARPAGAEVGGLGASAAEAGGARPPGALVQPAGSAIPLARNYALAALTGLLWYLQFFFYGLAHVRMGQFQFSSWAIHMIILILLSCGFGVAIGEWKASRRSTQWLIAGALLFLVSSVGVITYGNYLAAP